MYLIDVVATKRWKDDRRKSIDREQYTRGTSWTRNENSLVRHGDDPLSITHHITQSHLYPRRGIYYFGVWLMLYAIYIHSSGLSLTPSDYISMSSAIIYAVVCNTHYTHNRSACIYNNACVSCHVMHILHKWLLLIHVVSVCVYLLLMGFHLNSEFQIRLISCLHLWWRRMWRN